MRGLARDGRIQPVVNLVIDPSFVRLGSTSTRGSGVSSALDAAYSVAGAGSIRVTCDGSVLGQGISMSPGIISPTRSSLLQASIWMRLPLGALMLFVVEEYTTNSIYVRSASGNIAIVGTGDWQRYSAEVTVTSGNIARIITQTRGTAQAITFYIDAAMLTSGPTLWPYADGDTAGWVWDGPAGASTSRGWGMTTDQGGVILP